MKKTIITIAILFVGTFLYAQDSTKVKSEVKDSITASDLAKTRYIVSAIVMQYYRECYLDSIPLTDFYGKPVTSVWWKEKGRYYWDIFEPLPSGVKYLHRRMTPERLLEEFSTKLGGNK